MKFLVAGGGTAGHITPLLSVIDEIKNKLSKSEIVFVGSRGGIEERLIPQAGIRMITIDSGKFRRYYSNLLLNVINPTTFLKNFRDSINFVKGIGQSYKILKEEKPDIIFLKGGYVTLPLGIACILTRRKYFIHESDVVMGLANRILAKKAVKVFVSFEPKNYDIEKERLVYSGNPVRRDILVGSKTRAKETFRLEEKTPTILIIGGSQGSHIMNSLIGEKLHDYLTKFQLIHLAGDYDLDFLEYKAKGLPDELQKKYKLFNFISKDLGDAYAAADLVISRAGNNVLCELAALGKATIIIPLESSANNHQLSNAKVLSRDGAAYLMLQSHLTSKKLFRQVELLMEDKEEREFMKNKIKTFFKEDAQKVIVSEMISYYNSNPSRLELKDRHDA